MPPKRARTYVELEGQDDVRKAFARMEFAALREAKVVIAESAEEIKTEAQARVPYDEGTTHDSITNEPRDFGLGATIGSGYYNARFIEQGTSKQAARPFLNPAFQLVRPKYLNRLRAALGLAVKEAAL